MDKKLIFIAIVIFVIGYIVGFAMGYKKAVLDLWHMAQNIGVFSYNITDGEFMRGFYQYSGRF